MLVELLKQQPWFDLLTTRRRSILAIIEYLDKFPPNQQLNIVETGSLRIRDNWQGDGQSSRIWDWVIQNREKTKCISIDVNEQATELTKKLCPNVNAMYGNSLTTLPAIDRMYLKDTFLLYLDSFDWEPRLNFESAFHHLCELSSIYALLPKDCLIVVDDRHDMEFGKHWMVEAFLKTQGASELFRGYQIGWVKH